MNNTIFDEVTRKRLNVITKVKPLHSDSLIKYVTSLEPIIFQVPEYTKKLRIQPNLEVLYESRFANFKSITDNIKSLNTLYTLDLNPHKVKIYGYTDVSESFLYHIGNIILWWSSIHYKKYNERKEFNITLYLTDLKKQLPVNNFTLNEESVNSGFTFIQSPNEIHIFRKEECLKVLLHELIHASSYDFNNSNLVNLPVKLRDDNITNEGITEYFAIIHYDWYIANFLKDSIYKNTSLSELFLELLSNELYWQEYQIYKIFKFFNMQPQDLLNEHNNFSQKTSVLSYYIFKHFLFTQYSLPILLSRNYDSINNLISKFSDYIKNFNTTFPNYSSSINESLRMSLYELNF